MSPKNILVGPCGPILIDAECAWYGDPAFDLAFCLNHLLLKCLWNRSFLQEYLRCFNLMAATYLAKVNWEPVGDLEKRIAHLLPALLLSRVDGKSPVEYITDEFDKNSIRTFAKKFLTDPVDYPRQISAAWASCMAEVQSERDENSRRGTEVS